MQTRCICLAMDATYDLRPESQWKSQEQDCTHQSFLRAGYGAPHPANQQCAESDLPSFLQLPPAEADVSRPEVTQMSRKRFASLGEPGILQLTAHPEMLVCTSANDQHMQGRAGSLASKPMLTDLASRLTAARLAMPPPRECPVNIRQFLPSLRLCIISRRSSSASASNLFRKPAWTWA